MTSNMANGGGGGAAGLAGGGGGGALVGDLLMGDAEPRLGISKN